MRGMRPPARKILDLGGFELQRPSTGSALLTVLALNTQKRASFEALEALEALGGCGSPEGTQARNWKLWRFRRRRMQRMQECKECSCKDFAK